MIAFHAWEWTIKEISSYRFCFTSSQSYYSDNHHQFIFSFITISSFYELGTTRAEALLSKENSFSYRWHSGRFMHFFTETIPSLIKMETFLSLFAIIHDWHFGSGNECNGLGDAKLFLRLFWSFRTRKWTVFGRFFCHIIAISFHHHFIYEMNRALFLLVASMSSTSSSLIPSYNCFCSRYYLSYWSGIR